MIEIDAIFFDLDGTLVDSRKDIVNSTNYMLKQLDLEEQSYEEIVSYIGGGIDDFVTKTLKDKDRDLHEKGLKIFYEHYEQHSTEETELFPGVKETLEHFGDKEMIIVTNKSSYLTDIAVKELGISGYFSHIVGGDDVHCLKPSGCPLEKAISKLGRDLAKDKLLMVGDMPTDIESAKRVGIKSCGVTYGVSDRESLSERAPDILIDNFIDLKSKIR